MRILVCTVGKDGPARKVADNSKRLKALEDLLDRALKIRGGVDLIVLPGGYFFSPEPNPAKMPMLKQIWAAIKKRGVAVCFGIDTGHKQPLAADTVRRNRLPAFGFAWTAANGRLGPWRQRSTNHHNQRDAGQGLITEDRSFRVGAYRVAPLVCGELFNRRILAALQTRGVNIVVDLVHTGKGFRFSGAGKYWSSAKPIKAALMSCHAKRREAMKCWSVGGVYRSTRKASVTVSNPVRIEGFLVSAR